MPGAALAALIARTIEGPYVLIGHSLGARVMVTAAQTLATQPGPPRVEPMHLLGDAVVRKGGSDRYWTPPSRRSMLRP